MTVFMLGGFMLVMFRRDMYHDDPAATGKKDERIKE
jgi:hypothetical protein